MREYTYAIIFRSLVLLAEPLMRVSDGAITDGVSEYGCIGINGHTCVDTRRDGQAATNHPASNPTRSLEFAASQIRRSVRVWGERSSGAPRTSFVTCSWV